jgi:hypothetical protein
MSNHLLETIQRLTDVLTEENDALKRLDFSAAVTLVPAKEAALAQLTTQPGVGTLPPALAARAQLLSSLAIENQMLLQRAITVQTRIVRIVARAGASQSARTRYDGRGLRSPSHRAAALALSTRA